MSEVCGLEHLYSDAKCVLPAGHDDAPDWLPHQAANGFRWERHEEIYAEGTEHEGTEEWDVPIEDSTSPKDLTSTIYRAALFDEVGVPLATSVIPVPPRLRPGDSFSVTLSLTL